MQPEHTLNPYLPPEMDTPASGQAKTGPVAFAVALGAAGAALLWFLLRLSPALTFGPWQGVLLDPEPLFRAPQISHWLVQYAALWLPVNPATASNLVSSAAGAVLCGALAWLVCSLLRPLSGSIPAAVAGLAAALLCALMSPVLMAATGPDPAILTAACAIVSLACFLPAMSGRHSAGMLLACGAAGGLAAANHPSFFLIFIVYVLLLILFGQRLSHTLSALAYFTVSFAITATLPAFQALHSGQSFAQLLSSALQLPYPTLGDASPDLAYGQKLFQVFPFGVFLLTLPGMLYLFRSRANAAATTLLVFFLMLGPLLPFFTNQYSNAHSHMDTAAPLLVVLALLCALATTGAVALPALLFSERPRRRLMISLAQVSCVVAAAAAGIYWLKPALPDRNHHWAGEIAGMLLEPLPPHTLLLVENQSLYSLVRAAQLDGGLRTDVVPVPARMLSNPAHRTLLARHLPESAELPLLYPDEKALERWRKSLPFHFARLTRDQEGRGTHRAIDDFAFWDFVAGNMREQPIAFAGISTDWLTARAAAHGLTLLYPPATEAPASDRLHLRTPEEAPADPMARETLATLLLPLSDHALRNAHPERALQLAELATRYAPNMPEPIVAMLHARARQGAQDAVITEAGRFLARWHASYSNDALSASITEHLDREKSERLLTLYLEAGLRPDEAPEERDEVFGQLWKQEQFALLDAGYARILEQAPEDLDALYQLAAVHAQLGHWRRADELLGQWVQAGRFPASEVLQQLLRDGRFALFHQYRRPTYLSPAHML